MIYLDGFSGYGGFRHAFELEGWKFDKVYFSEIDKYAIANYKYNFPESEWVGSISDIRDIGKIDLFTFGWPCQDNSIAGKRKGQSGDTRSGLLFSAINCIERFKPRNFVAENVKGLLSVNKGIDIVESLKVLSFLNDSCPQYDVEMQLLNTRWFLPQNRERLFFVGHLRGSGSRKIFPIGEDNTNTNKAEFRRVEVDSGQGRKLEIRDNVAPLRANTGAGHGNYVITDNLYSGRTRDYINETPTLTSNLAGRLKVNKIRRLTPIECERLQGLPDNWTKNGIFEKEVWINKKEKTFRIIEGLEEISDTQRYRLCGNGVSIPPVREIAKRLKL